MKKKIKILLIFLLLIILSIISLYLIERDLIEYSIVSITTILIVFVILVISIAKREDIRSKYNQDLRKILKKYDAILVETSTIPNIENKNIMLITNIEDMIDASLEIRKPIYYKKEQDYCIFVLLDNQDACIYILKLHKEEDTDIEVFIRERKTHIEDLISYARDNVTGTKSYKKKKDEII